jgi:regulator of sigma E protease
MALLTILAVVFLFGMTVLVHELGHFLVARALGLVVDVFSIGFGPALWKRKVGSVTYKIGCIPFGGYVALPQLDPTGMALVQGGAESKATDAAGGDAKPAEPPRSIPPIAPWKRILVSVAGAAGNIVFAFLIAWVVFVVGKPASPEERNATVGFVDEASVAYAAGLRVGDEVLTVNGYPVRNWVDFRLECVRYKEVRLAVRRGAATNVVEVATEKGVLGALQVAGVDGRSLCMVAQTDAGMAADVAGIRRGDIIVELDGQEVISRSQLIDLVARREGRTVPIRVRRGSEHVTSHVTPAMDPARKQVRIGVHFSQLDYELDQIAHPGTWEQVRSHATAIVRMLDALTTRGQAKAASEAVGGPVAILIGYWFIARASLMLAVWFTGFLNVNLAILNLLPIPVLDGGHVVFSALEWILRRPLNARIVNAVTNAFAVLIIALAVLLTTRDVDRMTPVGRTVRGWFGKEKPPSEQVEPASSPEPDPDAEPPPEPVP